MPRSSKPDPDDPAACERAAVALLARREHTRRELARKLSARAFDADVVAATLDRLEQAGLLDGRRFIESFVASRAARGFGPVKIRAELLERGVDPGSASEALRESAEDWRAHARSVRRKRFGAEAPKDFKERARQARFLQYRGFDQEQIDAALDLQEDYD
ncbi:MAG TPA: regulatory protein RecX [Gammaproteobacteria bacterium]|nr:regulatory protein RecX [Gammaproteobacteria bacterium]